MSGGPLLLAEDDRVLRRAVEVMLRRHGYEVLLAADGEEALAQARTGHPRLVLLDVMMPKMLGLEVLKQLKADPATAAIPVVMLSNLDREADHREALEAGALGFIVKANIRLNRLAEEVDAIVASLAD